MKTTAGLISFVLILVPLACGDDSSSDHDTTDNGDAAADSGGGESSDIEGVEPTNTTDASKTDAGDTGADESSSRDGGTPDGGAQASDESTADAALAAAPDGSVTTLPDAAGADSAADQCVQPVLLGTFEPPSGNAEGFSVDGDRLYLASTSAGVYVVDISDQTQPTNIGQYDFPPGQLAFRVAAQGNQVAVALRGNGWALLDVSDLEDINLLASDDNVSAEDVGLSGTTLFCADGDGVGSVDISDPENPVSLTDDLVLPGASMKLLVAGDLVYVASLGGGISIVDASDPAALTEIITIDVGTLGSTHMALQGSTLYAAHDEGVTIIDVSEPSEPEVLGQYARELTHELVVSGDHLFVFGADTTSIDVPFLAVVDVSEPSAPVEENTSLTGFDSPVFGMIVGDTLIASVEDDDSLHLFRVCLRE